MIVVEMDHQTGVVRLLRSDGKAATVPNAMAHSLPRIASTFYAPGCPGMLMTCDDGTSIVFEARQDLHDPRPIAYLDQNQWSMIAKCLLDPSSQSSPNVAAAQQLSGWCDQRKLRLPLSMGHMLETGYWTDNKRREYLAITMLRMSRGWNMRHPLDIRRAEVYRHLIGKDPVLPGDVFTLEPVAYAQAQDSVTPKAPVGFSDDLIEQFNRLVDLHSHVAVMLSPSPSKRTQDSKWQEVNQKASELIDSCATSRQREECADRILLVDMAQLFVQTAESANVDSLPNDADPQSFWRDFVSCGSLMFYRELYKAKHVDPGSKWEANDLLDLTYLAVGAAYADFLACERKTSNLVKRASRKLNKQVEVTTNLPALVASLEARIADSPDLSG